MKYLRNHWTDLRHIHTEDGVWSLAQTNLNVKGQGHQGQRQITEFSTDILGTAQLICGSLVPHSDEFEDQVDYKQKRGFWQISRELICDIFTQKTCLVGPSLGWVWMLRSRSPEIKNRVFSRSLEALNWFATNSHGRCVWSLAETSLKVSINFGILHAVCLETHFLALVYVYFMTQYLEVYWCMSALVVIGLVSSVPC